MNRDVEIQTIRRRIERAGVAEYLKQASEATQVAPGSILGRRRYPRLVRARATLYRALYAKGWTLSEIGELMGRDHTTVAFSLKAIGVTLRPQYRRKETIGNE